MDRDIELRYFVAVAEELHFGRVAQRLYLAQPPLSQQIRKLEAILGFSPFTSTSRAVKLTSTEEIFLECASRTLHNVQEDLDDARCIGRGEVGFLRVGFIGSAMLTPLPQMLGTYRRQFPKVHIQLHESFTASVVHSLLNGFLDAGCLRDGGPSPASAQGEARALVFRPLLLASPQKQLLHIQPVLHPLIPLHIHIVR